MESVEDLVMSLGGATLDAVPVNSKIKYWNSTLIRDESMDMSHYVRKQEKQIGCIVRA